MVRDNADSELRQTVLKPTHVGAEALKKTKRFHNRGCYCFKNTVYWHLIIQMVPRVYSYDIKSLSL